MIGTIIPTVCGNSNQHMINRKPGLLALHGLGYVIGAITAGAVVGMIGQFILMFFGTKPSGSFVFKAIGIVSVLYGLHELRFLREQRLIRLSITLEHINFQLLDNCDLLRIIILKWSIPLHHFTRSLPILLGRRGIR